MLPALTTHLKPISASLCVLLQTTLARLLPSLWWAAPPDKLFHLSPRHYCRLTAAVPPLALLLPLFKAAMVCLSHFTLHFDSGLWSLPHFGLDPTAPRLWLPRRPPDPFFGFCFFSCDKAPPRRPWKIWWLIWGSDVANAVHNQKFQPKSGYHKCALSNIKIVWTHFKKVHNHHGT